MPGAFREAAERARVTPAGVSVPPPLALQSGAGPSIGQGQAAEASRAGRADCHPPRRSERPPLGPLAMPCASHSNASELARSKPVSGNLSRPARSSSNSAPGRVATSIATPSILNRRAANRSASAEEASIHCASSVTTNTPRGSAAAASSVNTAAPIEKRSAGWGCSHASTPSSPRACGGGSSGSRSMMPKHSSERPANGRSISDSTPRTSSTVMSSA